MYHTWNPLNNTDFLAFFIFRIVALCLSASPEQSVNCLKRVMHLRVHYIICPDTLCPAMQPSPTTRKRSKWETKLFPCPRTAVIPAALADRQDARLRLTLRSSAEAKGPACPTDRPPALREAPLICLQADSWTPTDGAARNTPVPSLHGPQVLSKAMCFHVGQIPQHTARWGGGGGGVKAWKSNNIVLHWFPALEFVLTVYIVYSYSNISLL